MAKTFEEEEFLRAVGWPESAMGMDGLLTRSAPCGEMETMRATVVRNGAEIELGIQRVGIAGPLERVMSASASVEEGAVSVRAAQAGDPPEEMLAEDAAELFRFLSESLGRPAFSPTGERKRSPEKSRP